MRGIRCFIAGVFFGGALVLAGTAMAVTKEERRQFAASLIYAVAELAVDTEKNAKRIVDLRERIDDLELQMDDLMKARSE